MENHTKYFQELQKIKEEDLRTLLRTEYRGLWKAVIEQYSGSAHFVYELLQNADDAKATCVEFDLQMDGLWIKHNGTERFSISNPLDNNTENKKIGHINAITAAGNSNKKENEIGKFGIGFKSVFAYSDTPHIYDTKLNFKLENYINPIIIDPRPDKHSQEETLFYFPFNHAEKNQNIAYQEINIKLLNLVYPNLFLNNIEEIRWKTENSNGQFLKKIIKTKIKDEISAFKIELIKKHEHEVVTDNVWLFKKDVQHFSEKNEKENISVHKIFVGFFTDKHEKLIQKNHSVFCFFPTKVNTNLNSSHKCNFG